MRFYGFLKKSVTTAREFAILSKAKMPSQPPKVFTSYSHDSSQYVERVLRFSQRLRQDGVDSWIDQYENGVPEEGWPRWMLNRIDWADFVLIVCTEVYYRRFRGKDETSGGKGADWEGQLVTLDIYHSKSRTVKFVPVLFEDRDAQFIPEPLRALTYYLLDPGARSSAPNYLGLLAFLHGKAGITPSPLGLPPATFRLEGGQTIYSVEMSKTSRGPSVVGGATALSPEDEPAVIKEFISKSKGIKKHWVNYTPDGYILTLLLPFSISEVDAATVRAYEILAQRVRSDLESHRIPVQMILTRSSEGVLFAAG